MKFTSIINKPGSFYDQKENRIVEFWEIMEWHLELPAEEILAYSMEYAKVCPEVADAILTWSYTPPQHLIEDLCGNESEAEGWKPLRAEGEKDQVEVYYYGGYITVVGLPGTPPDPTLMREVELQVLEAIKQERLDREASRKAWNKRTSLREEFFSQLQAGDQWTYISHDSEGVKFQVGNRIVTIGAGASMVDYDECKGFISFEIQEA